MWPQKRLLHFGDIPVAAVGKAHVIAALKPTWQEKTETASRVRNRVELVLDYAKAHGWRDGDNPAVWKGNLAAALPARSKVAKVKHHAALPMGRDWRVHARTVEAERLRGRMPALCHCDRRPLWRGARWLEIAAATTWRVPADRMKASREHKAPLSDAAIAVLAEMFELRATTDPDALIFPGADGQRPLSDMTLTACLRRMNREDLTCHGFRSTFRDWAAESTTYPGDVVEMALAPAR